MSASGSIAFVVLNDESFRGGDPTEDERLLVTLGETFGALRLAVSVHDADRVRSCVAREYWTITLPSGAGLVEALGALGRRSREAAGRLRGILLNSPAAFDERGDVELAGSGQLAEVTLRDELVPSVRAAWLLRGLVWSADRAGWQTERIGIQVREPPGDFRDEQLANAFCADLAGSHRDALAFHVRVMPKYDDPGHHNPERVEHRKYRHEKSLIPKHAERILRYALPVDGGTTWWAQCACAFYHRYQGNLLHGRVVVHWNGTTNPNAMGNQPGKGKATTADDVPPEVKKELAENAKRRALGDSDCGCRELRGPGQL